MNVKNFISLLLFTSLLLVGINNSTAQFLQQQSPDTLSPSVTELLDPGFRNLNYINTDGTSSLNPFSEVKTVPFKLVFSALSNIVHGQFEGAARRDLELGYRYPDPTISYPENVTELELFLERNNQYN